MSGRLHIGFALAALALPVGCSGKVGSTGGLMLVFASDATVHPDRLHVKVASKDGTTVYQDANYPIDAQHPLPTTLAVASNGSPTAAVSVIATVWSGSTALDVREEQVLEIPTDRVAELDFLFSSACTATVQMAAGVATSTCPTGKTCDPGTGGCVGDVVNAGTLPTFGADGGGVTDVPEAGEDSDAGITDAMGSSPDATTRSDGGQGGPDAGADTGSTDATVADVVDATADVDAASANTVTFTMTPFTVQPGAEVYKCQPFGNPFGGNADLTYYDGTVSSDDGGSGILRRFVAFSEPRGEAGTAGGPLGDCTSTETHPFPYFSQAPHTALGYPDAAMGYPLSYGNGLTLYVDYANPGTSPIAVNAQLTVTVASAGTVTTHVGSILLDNLSIAVPPMGTVTDSKTATPLTSDFNLLAATSFMTKQGTQATASQSGTTLYSTTNATGPALATFTPSMAVQADAGITWSCTFNNTGPTTVTFPTAMCLFVGQYFPADPANPDVFYP